jgi:DNA-binding PadR family transcriptional regulator
VLTLEDAPLYKALHRLERRGHVVAEWGLSEHNRRARYYQLTPAGRAQLAAEAASWRRYAAAVFRVLDPAPDAGLDLAPGA